MTSFNKNAQQNPRARRTGSTLVFVLFLIVVIAVVAGVVWFFLRPAGENQAEMPILQPVKQGPFEHTILEQGEVESAENVEIRCEVKSGNSAGMVILEIVPEGTHVEEGDLLVKLDSSGFEQELKQQQIICNTSEALVIQAKSAYDTAVIAKTEYLEGTFVQEEKLILNELYVAEDALKKAQLDLASGKRLLAKGLLTELQLEGQRFAVEKAKNELDAATTKLEVLRKFTKQKMLKQLESDIAAAKAKWDAEQSSHEIELDKLQEIKDQIAKCTLLAPQAGTVVYANVFSRRGGTEFVVEPGAMVRERQALIRLPKFDDMQVKATINESRINLVRAGMPVTIRLDALQEQTFEGRVLKVNQYAEPGSWTSGNVKEYATFVKILNPVPAIRPGMNAEVRIHVEQRDNAVQVPVQTVCEHQGRFFCLVRENDGWATRQVSIGSSNDSFMTVEDGLNGNEMLAMNPRGYSSLLELPDLPEAEVVRVSQPRFDAAAQPQADPGADDVAAKPQDRPATPAAGGGPGLFGQGEDRPGPAAIAGFIMQRFDTDGDGTISSEELSAIPADRQSRFADADANGDSSLDAGELAAAMSRMGGLGGGPPGAGE